MLNAYTLDELKQIVETMENVPALAQTMTIELRRGETSGRITRDQNQVVFIPTHHEAPRGPYGRD